MRSRPCLHVGHAMTKRAPTHLGHLVSAFAAAHVHNRIRVRELGEGLRDNGLATSERTGHGTGTTLHRPEAGVIERYAGVRNPPRGHNPSTCSSELPPTAHVPLLTRNRMDIGESHAIASRPNVFKLTNTFSLKGMQFTSHVALQLRRRRVVYSAVCSVCVQQV